VTLAIQLHVVYILNVAILMDRLHVHVWQLILDLHQTVVPNVQSTLSALVTKLVYKKNAEILVLDLVVSMQFALLLIIHQLAHVQKETQEIPSQIVIQNLLHVRYFSLSLLITSFNCAFPKSMI
jgi:hypothetical protein